MYLANILQIAIKLYFYYCLYYRKTPVLQTPTQVFSRKICEIFKSTYFEEHLRATASESFILSFSKMWSLSSGDKLLSPANTLTVILFRGGYVGTWFGLTYLNTEGGCLALSLPKPSFVGQFLGQGISHTTVFLVSGVLSLGIIVNHLSLSSKFLVIYKLLLWSVTQNFFCNQQHNISFPLTVILLDDTYQKSQTLK